jgi:hypothetical protein
VATHSFANGLVYWVVGFVALLVLPAKPTTRWSTLALWFVCAAITLFSFYYGYTVSEQQRATRLLHDPIQGLLYVLVFLGTPIVNFHIVGAALAGVLGIGIFAASLSHLAQRRHVPVEHLLPYVCIGLYAIGSAGLTSMGRGGLGIQQAMSSRYITNANLLWISNIVLMSLAFALPPVEADALRPKRQSLGKALLLFLLPFFFYSYFAGMQTGAGLGNAVRLARQAILETYPNVDPNIMRVLNTNQHSLARQNLDKLAQYRLSLFRDAPERP